MTTRLPYQAKDFLRFLLCAPFFYMLGLLVIEAALAALTTWLVIQAGQDLANEEFLLRDFGYIVLAQSAAYVVGAISWVFAERAGFGAFGRYMLRFAKDNKTHTQILANKDQRELVEPFLTNETFHIFFELVYELEADLKLFFNLLFNTVVLGVALDAGLPAVYGVVFIALLVLQVSLRKWISNAYAQNQRATNRMTAHTYTAWDNIFAGNRYNFSIWHSGFKERLRAALKAQIRSIMAREGIAAVSGIFALLVVFAYLAYVAGQALDNSALLIALAATLPRQIDMSYNLHGLATGWNDLLAIWTRILGASNAMHPAVDADFDRRIRFDKLQLRYSPSSAALGAPPAFDLPCSDLTELHDTILAHSVGRIQVRGSNGAGKSTLLAAMKSRLGAQAFYWPTSDQLAFAFNKGQATTLEDEGDSQTDADLAAPKAKTGFSSGEQQLKSLREIVKNTQSRFYLLDEWDANLDAKNASEAQALVNQLAQRALVLEISHRQ